MREETEKCEDGIVLVASNLNQQKPDDFCAIQTQTIDLELTNTQTDYQKTRLTNLNSATDEARRRPHLASFKGKPDTLSKTINSSESRDIRTTSSIANDKKNLVLGKQRRNTESIKSKKSIANCNSLESVSSNFLTSSTEEISTTNDNISANLYNDTIKQSPSHQIQMQGQLPPSAIISTRYVTPPRVPSDQDSDLFNFGQHNGDSESSGHLDKSSSYGQQNLSQNSDVLMRFSSKKLECEGSCKCPKDNKSHIGAKHNDSSDKRKDSQSLNLKYLPDDKRDSKPQTSPFKGEPPFRFAGCAASMLCSVLFSCSILCIKLLPGSNTLQEKLMAVCFRGIFLMLLCGLSLIIQRTPITVRRDEIWVNFLRSLFGYLGVLSSYVSLSYISMGDSTALVFSSPVWTSILSYLILGEPFRYIQLFALPASLLGIVLIAHPALILPDEHLPVPQIDGSLSFGNFSESTGDQVIQQVDGFDFTHRWPGIAIALGASLCVSCVYIVLKFRKSTPIQTTTFWLGFTTFLASLVLMTFVGFGHWPDTYYEWGLIFGNGFFSWLGQSALQWAFYYEEASVLSVVRTLDVAGSFIASALFLDDQILWTSVAGAIIIALVVVSVMLNNWIIEKLTSRSATDSSRASAA